MFERLDSYQREILDHTRTLEVIMGDKNNVTGTGATPTATVTATTATDVRDDAKAAIAALQKDQGTAHGASIG